MLVNFHWCFFSFNLFSRSFLKLYFCFLMLIVSLSRNLFRFILLNWRLFLMLLSLNWSLFKIGLFILVGFNWSLFCFFLNCHFLYYFFSRSLFLMFIFLYGSLFNFILCFLRINLNFKDTNLLLNFTMFNNNLFCYELLNRRFFFILRSFDWCFFSLNLFSRRFLVLNLFLILVNRSLLLLDFLNKNFLMILNRSFFIIDINCSLIIVL